MSVRASDDHPEYRVETFPMLDTGLGREAGFASDAELIAAAEAERAALPPAMREAVDEIDREIERRVLGLPNGEAEHDDA